MSATFTLPVTANDSFGHGHAHTGSKSHQRHRASSRLAPPFALPRIPSESIVQQQVAHSHEHPHEHGHEHDDMHHHSHNSASFSVNSLIPSPSLDFKIGKRKDSDASSIYTPPVAAYKPVIHNVSKPTAFLLRRTESYPLMHGILADVESRRIFYFMLLNLSFMAVQSTYGYLTGSLGLISDSIHMFFDCVALFVGVCAAVMSKWSPSVKFPYGYGKIDTLAGLGNGIFLMLISVEIVYEAMERLFAGADVSRTTELLIVSTVGLGVNLVGIMAFHGHHGHDHGHDHSSSHEHDHGHAHSHSDASPDVMTASSSPTKAKQSAGGHHHHGGENMQGIYLHIMADALGSVAVVLSTLLIQLTGWSGWDPLASCIIAVLIFISTVPLVSSTTKILLLSLNSDIEYNLRDILAGVSNIRGVVGYSVPKFWLEDVKKEPGHHGHSHGHDHGHDHHHHDRKVSDDHCSDESNDPTVLGVIHVIASKSSDLGDVGHRVSHYFAARKMDVVVQMERENDSRCWCGGGLKTS